MSLRDYQKKFVAAAFEKYGSVLTKAEAYALAKELGMRNPMWFVGKKYRIAHGKFALPLEGKDNGGETISSTNESIANTEVDLVENVIPMDKYNKTETVFEESLIPEKDPLFVKFGFAKSLTKIFKSKMFYPVFVTGLSGNGKTFMVEQIAALTKRELIRVNVTNETDEDDLMGGFRLVNGETRFFKGPVLKAMERGAILLVDEVDAGNPNKLLALHGPLEGKGYFIKKTGEFVKPTAGFTVIATANTKGKGSEDGRFIGTNVLNEAFLERFCVTIEQEYPSVAVEKKILGKVFKSLDLDEKDTFIGCLVDWADVIRKSFYEGVCDEIIATRRLVHIAKTYAIFKDRLEAVTLATNRFDDETKSTFIELYEKVDAEASTPTEESEEDSEKSETDSPETDKGGEDLAPF